MKFDRLSQTLFKNLIKSCSRKVLLSDTVYNIKQLFRMSYKKKFVSRYRYYRKYNNDLVFSSVLIEFKYEIYSVYEVHGQYVLAYYLSRNCRFKLHNPRDSWIK